MRKFSDMIALDMLTDLLGTDQCAETIIDEIQEIVEATGRIIEFEEPTPNPNPLAGSRNLTGSKKALRR
jgi:hypothetical protein